MTTREAKVRRRLGWMVAIAAAVVVLVVAGVAGGLALGRRSGSAAPTAGPSMPSREMVMAALPPETRPAPATEPVDGRSTAEMLRAARTALDQRNFLEAIPLYKRVLAREPRNPDALTHMGLILYQANHVDRALGRVDEAIASDPRYARAHWIRANMLFEGKQDYAGAAAAGEAFLKLAPAGEDAERARALVARARTRAAEATRALEAPPK